MPSTSLTAGGLLKGALEGDGPYTFIVGAGVSVPSGLPGFETFSKAMLASLLPQELTLRDCETREETINAIAWAVRPEIVMQVVLDVVGDVATDFYAWLGTGKPNGNHLFLAAALRAGHHVVTPNLDSLIEAAHGDDAPVVRAPKAYEEWNAGGGVGTLFKFHGSVENSDGLAPPRVSIDGVGGALSGEIEEKLCEVIAGRPVIVVGYRGMDHFSLQPVMMQATSEHDIYWIAFEPAVRDSTFHTRTKDEVNADLVPLMERRFETKRMEEREATLLEALRGMSARSRAHLASCDATVLMHYAIGLADPKYDPLTTMNPPAWTNTLSDTIRHEILAGLLEAGGFYDELATLLRDEEKMGGADPLGAAMRRAQLGLIQASADSIRSALEDLSAGLDATDRAPHDAGVLQAKAALVNLYRRAKDHEAAWKVADEQEAILASNAASPDMRDVIRRSLAAQRALLWDADPALAPEGYDDAHAKEDRALALKASERMPRHYATSLNTAALTLSKKGGANGDVALLHEAEGLLKKALDLNLALARWRECYQNTRNLAWTYLNLAKADAPANRERYLRDAEKAAERAEEFVIRMGPHVASGEYKGAQNVQKTVQEALNSLSTA